MPLVETTPSRDRAVRCRSCIPCTSTSSSGDRASVRPSGRSRHSIDLDSARKQSCLRRVPIEQFHPSGRRQKRLTDPTSGDSLVLVLQRTFMAHDDTAFATDDTITSVKTLDGSERHSAGRRTCWRRTEAVRTSPQVT